MTQRPHDLPWDEGLQPERTTLSWIRTHLSFVVVSVLTARLARDSGPWALVAALSGTIVGSLLVAVQARSHQRRDNGARAGAHIPPFMTVAATTALAVMTSILALVLVLGPALPR